MTYLTSAADGLVCLTARNVVSYISGHHVKFKFFVFLFCFLHFGEKPKKKWKYRGRDLTQNPRVDNFLFPTHLTLFLIGGVRV
jgi:hypothetical protein